MRNLAIVWVLCATVLPAISGDVVQVSGKFEAPGISYKGFYVFSPSKSELKPSEGRANIAEDGSFSLDVSATSTVELLSVHDTDKESHIRGLYFRTKQDTQKEKIIIDAKSTALFLLTFKFNVQVEQKKVATIMKYPEKYTVIEKAALRSKCFPVFQGLIEKEIQKPSVSDIRKVKANLTDGENCAAEISKDPKIVASQLVYSQTKK